MYHAHNARAPQDLRVRVIAAVTHFDFSARAHPMYRFGIESLTGLRLCRKFSDQLDLEFEACFVYINFASFHIFNNQNIHFYFSWDYILLTMPLNAPPTHSTLYFDNIRFASMSAKKVKEHKTKSKSTAPPPSTSKPSTKNYEEAFASLQLQFGASGHSPCPAHTPKFSTK